MGTNYINLQKRGAMIMLTRNPFDNDVLDTSKYLTKAQEEAVARMSLSIQSNTLGVLTGEIGSGKSTVMRHLTTSIPTDKYDIIYLCISNLRPKDLYSEVLYKLGETTPFYLIQAKRLLQETILQRQKQSDKIPLLIIDEAHELQHESIMELRILMNYEMDLKSGFPIILCGQPELRRILKLKKFEPISQRIKMQYHLGGLSREEISEYIKFRLSEIGLERPVFSESSIAKIFSYTQGIPRIVNTICHGAIFDAETNKEEVIEDKHIAKVLNDLERQKGLIC